MAQPIESDDEDQVQYAFAGDSSIDIENIRFQSDARSSEVDRPVGTISYNMRVRTEPPEKPKRIGTLLIQKYF